MATPTLQARLDAAPARAAGRCYLTHLECSLTGERRPAGEVVGLSAAGRPMLARYDLPAIARDLRKEDLRERAPDMWRYREFLPMRDAASVVSLGETITPLLDAPSYASRHGGCTLLVKDEGRLPTGSFKSRGIAMAVTLARELGVRRAVIPTAGNAGAAFASYCARAGIESYVFAPDDAPEATLFEAGLFTQHVWKVNGLITDLAPIVRGGVEPLGWYDMSTLKEPYRIEGKKTMGLELAEQLGWQLPDFIFYPTGGGTGLIGMWKAFAELGAIGWLGARRPRMVAVQSRTCAPIVRAFERGADEAEPWEGGHTSIPGVRVPWSVGDRLMLQVLRESDGFGVAIDDAEADQARRDIAASDGIHLCPEGAATLAAYRNACRDGRVPAGSTVVLFNCATGLKYPLPATAGQLDRRRPIDYAGL
jgi:threonine synthase